MSAQDLLGAALAAGHKHYQLFALIGFTYVFVTTVSRYDLIPARWRHMLGKLPSPGLGNLFMGHFATFMMSDGTCMPARQLLDWHESLGEVYVLRDFLGARRIMVHDPVALQFCKTRTDIFHRPVDVRKRLAFILGPGLLSSEDEKHRQQRKVINPAFSGPAIQDLSEVFSPIAVTLVEQWEQRIEAESADDKRSGERSATINVLDWFSRAALDVIGEAGFGVQFHTLDDDSARSLPSSHKSQHNRGAEEFSAIARMFAHMSEANSSAGTVALVYSVILIILLPLWLITMLNGAGSSILRLELAVKSKLFAAAHILIRARRDGLAREQEKADGRLAKNLLTQILQSNAATDAKTRLDDAEVIGQLASFIAAGHETSATALSWIMHLLALHPDIQADLRTEVRQAKSEAAHRLTSQGQLKYEELSKLSLLDGVVREGLRIRPPVSASVQVAVSSTFMPLSKPVRLADGTQVTSLEIPKGTLLSTSTYVTNLRRDVWGEDAEEFNPKRWLDPQTGKKANLKAASVYSRTMTFLGGPHGCPGYRMAVEEIKAILAAIISRFEFDTLDDVAIEAHTAIVTRPRRSDAPSAGNQLPLRVRIAR